MISKKELERFLEDIAPEGGQEDWDNSGWQLELFASEIQRIYVALDINRAVIEDASKNNADVILSHHPMTTYGRKVISTTELYGEYIALLIRAGISVYSAHTSYDAAQGGMNDVLSGLLGLKRVASFAGIGRHGEFSEPRSLDNVVDLIKKQLGVSSLRISGRAAGTDKPISTVAVCGGGGGSLIEEAINGNYDLFFTGEIKHHDGLIAEDQGLVVIEAGHFGSEKVFICDVAKRLEETFGDGLEVLCSSINTDPFKIYS